MELLNSSWLLQMIDDSAKKPAEKLLSIYSCLNTWLMAPGVREPFTKAYSTEVPLAMTCSVLNAHLIKLAIEAKIPNPTVYVSQMFILLQGAIAVEIQNPGSGALLKARDAAEAVLYAVTPKPKAQIKQTLLIGSTVVSAVSLCLFIYMMPINTNASGVPLAQTVEPPPQIQMPSVISPDLVGRVMALKEHFDAGNCPAPQLLTIPQDQVVAYLNVVNSRGSEDPAMDSLRLRAFLGWYDQYKAWECYFPAENKQKIILGMGK